MSEAETGTRGGSWALGALVFAAGACLMCVEIVGGMTIAPWFGSNVFVWGSVISAFMAALSLGYVLGGRVADSGAGRAVLAGLTAGAGVLVAGAAFAGPAACRALLGLEVGGEFNVMRPLLAVVLLYFAPSVLLGMISPIAVAVASTAVASVGRVVGRLYALNALGSVAGALAATFVLVPRFGNHWILLGAGVALIAVGVGSFLFVRGRSAVRVAAGPAEGSVLSTAGLRPLVFVCGAVLMSLEVVGGAEIAPYFGSSVFVWGSVISVFLGAMTAGYRLGGWFADRRPRVMTLAGVVVAAGVATLLIPLIAPATCRMFPSGTVHSSASMLRPLGASLILYFVPVMLFAMVAPFAVRLSASQVGGVGGVAGRLYALSTAGNVVGVLLTTFVLISLVGKTHVLGLAGIATVGAAVAAVFLQNRAVGEKRQPVAVSAALMLVVALLALSPKPQLVPITERGEEIHGRVKGGWTLIGSPSNEGYRYVLRRIRGQYESPYHHIAVIEQRTLEPGRTIETESGETFTVERTSPYPTRRELRFDQYVESAVILNDAGDRIREPYTSGVTYSDLLHMPLVFQPEVRDVLIIGGGGGIVPTVFSRSYPQMKIDVVEIDPVVMRVAKQWFDLKESDRLRLHVQDGRMFVYNTRQEFDLVILDAYTAGGRIPFHLTTKEFLESVRARVRPNGVVLMNVISATQGPASGLFRAEYKTFAEVFGREHVYVFPKVSEEEEEAGPVWTGSRNVILIATGPEHKRRLAPAEVIERARSFIAEDRIKLRSIQRYSTHMLTELQLGQVPLGDVPVLRDDYAPVDTMMVSLDD